MRPLDPKRASDQESRRADRTSLIKSMVSSRNHVKDTGAVETSDLDLRQQLHESPCLTKLTVKSLQRNLYKRASLLTHPQSRGQSFHKLDSLWQSDLQR